MQWFQKYLEAGFNGSSTVEYHVDQVLEDFLNRNNIIPGQWQIICIRSRENPMKDTIKIVYYSDRELK